MDDLTVLVLGLGGNVSQGILKALRLSTLPVRIVGACVSPASAGLYGADRALISPPAADPNFLDWLVDTCLSEHVDAVLTGVEASPRGSGRGPESRDGCRRQDAS